MRIKNFIGLVIIIFLSIYITTYFYIKHTHAVDDILSVPVAFSLKNGSKMEVIVFYSKDKFDESLYYIFLPLGKLEKILNKNFSYDIIINKSTRTFSWKL